MNWTAILIILVVLGVIISNIMLVKYSTKMGLKNITRDPLEDAKARNEQRKAEANVREKEALKAESLDVETFRDETLNEDGPSSEIHDEKHKKSRSK